MENKINAYILQLNMLAVIVLLTVAFALFFKKDNVRANIFLGILLLYPALSILINIIFIIFQKYQLLFLAPMNVGINLTFGPVLLSYLHFIQGRQGKALASNIIQFVPAILVFLSASYYMQLPDERLQTLLAELIAGDLAYVNLINLLLLAHVFIYLFLAWDVIGLYAAGVVSLEASHISNGVKWQRSLIACFIAINLFLLLAFGLPLLLRGSGHVYADLIAAPLAAIVVYIFIVYRGITYHVIYNQSEYERFAAEAKPINDFVDELKSHAREDFELPDYKIQLVNETKSQLVHLFESEKVYTRSNIKLHDVAAMLNMSPALLSFVINRHMGMTFFEMLGVYRVEEAKLLLLRNEYQHYKIEHIGEFAGFNSRASFFAVFKKHVGKTPQAFRDDHTLER